MESEKLRQGLPAGTVFVELSAQAIAMLSDLAAQGIHGANVSQVAGRIIDARLVELAQRPLELGGLRPRSSPPDSRESLLRKCLGALEARVKTATSSALVDAAAKINAEARARQPLTITPTSPFLAAALESLVAHHAFGSAVRNRGRKTGKASRRKR